MESTSSLAFRGSISEAITEAKRKNKVLLVYVSGTDEDSLHLEQSTLGDPSVAELVLKDCIFLHLLHGSVDSVHFSAIYPMTSIPCISAVGYNGVLLWRNEGYVDAERLLSGIKKAWTDLHFQEAAATVLTAALVSNKPMDAGPSAADDPTHGKGSSEAANAFLSSNNGVSQGAETIHASEATSESRECVTESDHKFSGNPPPEMVHNVQPNFGAEDQKVLVGETTNFPNTVSDQESLECHPPSDVGASSPQHQEKSPSHSHMTDKQKGIVGHNTGLSRDGLERVSDAVERNANLSTLDSEAENLTGPSRVPSDIHLNIRLPSGTSIRETFSAKDTLRTVKNYIDENRTDDSAPYFLGIPYPRKLFSEQDMSKELSELGFVGRDALIVVPHQKSNTFHQRDSAPASNVGRPSEQVNDNGESLGFVWKILSYFNPFSYFRGTAGSNQELPQSDSSMWQYRPEPGLRNSLSSSERPIQGSSSSARALSGQTLVNKEKKPVSGWGSNVHTLKHDDEDIAFRDRNAFWNGNSTQYGGDDNK